MARLDKFCITNSHLGGKLVRQAIHLDGFLFLSSVNTTVIEFEWELELFLGSPEFNTLSETNTPPPPPLPTISPSPASWDS